MIKPHHRAPGFGLGVVLVSVCAARVGTGFRYKLALFGDFRTAVNGGVWADLGVALVAFLLGRTVWRQMARSQPPSVSQSIGLALVTSMAIGIALCLGTHHRFSSTSPRGIASSRSSSRHWSRGPISCSPLFFL